MTTWDSWLSFTVSLSWWVKGGGEGAGGDGELALVLQRGAGPSGDGEEESGASKDGRITAGGFQAIDLRRNM